MEQLNAVFQTWITDMKRYAKMLMDPEFYKENQIKVLIAIVFLTYPIVPFLLGFDYLVHLAIVANILAVIAMAWDLNGGYTGQDNLASGFFAGTCGYVSAILTTAFGWPIAAGLLAGTLASAGAALLIGFPALRIKGPYLAILTFSVAEVARLIVIYFSGITQGEEGIGGIPRIFQGVMPNYYWSLLIMVGAYLFLRAVMDSNLGLGFRAIAEDEIRAKTLGLDITRYKVLSFTICGLVCGFAGGIYAHYQAHIDPGFFSIVFAINIISLAAVGGEKTLVGAVIGAYVLDFSAELLRFVTGPVAWVRMSLHGLTLVLVMLFLPGGIMSVIKEQLSDNEESDIEDEES